MKRFFLLIGCLFLLVGCSSRVSPNSARLVELDNAGQIMPGVPAIEGGCYAEIGDNYIIDELTFENGDCTIKMHQGNEGEVQESVELKDAATGESWELTKKQSEALIQLLENSK